MSGRGFFSVAGQLNDFSTGIQWLVVYQPVELFFPFNICSTITSPPIRIPSRGLLVNRLWISIGCVLIMDPQLLMSAELLVDSCLLPNTHHVFNQRKCPKDA